MKKVCVIGAGSWGTALATVLAHNNVDVTLCMRDSWQKEQFEIRSRNMKYFPEVDLPKEIKYSLDVSSSVKGADAVILAVSSQGNRAAIKSLVGVVDKNTVIVNVSKGMEKDTHLLCSQISETLLPDNPFAVLSGPSHAEEVIIQMPTAVVVACKDEKIAQKVQDLFFNEYFRVYYNTDVTGVELGGALKNIIAFCIGIIDGLGYGDNTKAAIMTRGMTEIIRLSSALGANPATFSGLSGVGDLIVTCTSPHSRNRRAGELIGRGETLAQAKKNVGMVVEGIIATQVAYEISKDMNIDMPITHEIYEVLFKSGNVQDSVKKLMGRSKKHEIEITD